MVGLLMRLTGRLHFGENIIRVATGCFNKGGKLLQAKYLLE